MESNKLEKLVGYLPYGLKTEIKHVNHFNKITISELTPIVIVDWQRGNFLLKPILKPLSDLKISECFEKLSDKLKMQVDLFSIPNVNDIKVNDYNILLKNHFDIHGLIESGEAIDINTL